jgi:hypothetical protein
MNDKLDLALTLIVIFLVLGVLFLFLFSHINSKQEVKDDQIINTTTSSQYKFQALCPFNCIDMGFKGGYYSNLNKRCNCYMEKKQ